MSEQRFYANKFIFTSRAANTDIELTQGVSEELLIRDIKNETIYSKYPVGNSMGAGDSYHHTAANAQFQGTSVTIRDVGTDSYLAIGCPSDIVTGGGLGIFKSTNGGTFLEDPTLLQFIAGTLEGYFAEFSSLNETADVGAMTLYNLNGYNRSGAITRSGSVWSQFGDAWLGTTVKCSGDYILTGLLNEGFEMYVLNRDTNEVDLQQVLHTALGTSDWQPTDLIDQNTAVLMRSNVLQFWTRVGTTWTNISSLALAQTIVSVKLFANRCIAASATHIYIYKRFAFGSPYVLEDTLVVPEAGVLGVTFNATQIFLTKAAGVYVYTLSNEGVWQYGITVTPSVTSSKAISISDRYVAVGRPVNDAFEGSTIVFDRTAYETTSTYNNEINSQGIDLTLSSVLGNVVIDTPFVVSGTLEVDGVVTVNNVLQGLSQSVRWNGTTAQSIGSALAPSTLLVQVFDNGVATHNGTVMSTTSTVNGSVTLTERGFYQIIFQVDFASNSTGGRGLTLLKNAAGIASVTGGGVASGSNTILRGTTVTTGEIGDVFQINCFQVSGGALNAIRGNINVVRLGIIV